jgi:membrane protein YqaA with SNARE-associated domain
VTEANEKELTPEEVPTVFVPRWHLHRRLYNWVLGLAERRHSAWWLGGLSFAESSFFPIPPDVLLIPLVMGSRRRWLRFATVCSVASVLGAVLGYLIGWLMWDQLDWLFYNIPGVSPEGVEHVEQLFAKWNFWIVFTAGFTPIPFKLITITAGLFFGDRLGMFVVFLAASAVSRSARFFIVAGLLYRYGQPIRRWIDKYFNWVCLAFTILLVGGFVVVKYLL